MGIIEFILLQFIAHLLLDYFFQTGSLAKKKNSEGFKSGFLYWHALICFILSWVVSFQVNFVIGALIIAVSHLLLDGRSEEHTSELQSRPHLVCRLLLEKKNKNK